MIINTHGVSNIYNNMFVMINAIKNVLIYYKTFL